MAEFPPDVKSILDCGCASGLFPYILEKGGFEVDGFDILEEFVAFGQRKIKKGNIFQADIRNFEVDKMYDLISCIDVIKRFDRAVRQEIIFNMFSHLKIGKYVLLVNPSKFWFRINFLWRLVRKLLFRKMIFQDDFCGENVASLEKVRYYDEIVPLSYENPSNLFTIIEDKTIVFGLLSVVIAKKVNRIV